MCDSLMTCQEFTLSTRSLTHLLMYVCTRVSLAASRKRVKESIFPGSLHPNSEAPGTTRILPNQQTNLEQLARPSQMVKTAIANLINYQVITGFKGQRSKWLFVSLYGRHASINCIVQ